MGVDADGFFCFRLWVAVDAVDALLRVIVCTTIVVTYIACEVNTLNAIRYSAIYEPVCMKLNQIGYAVGKNGSKEMYV